VLKLAQSALNSPYWTRWDLLRFNVFS